MKLMWAHFNEEVEHACNKDTRMANVECQLEVSFKGHDTSCCQNHVDGKTRIQTMTDKTTPAIALFQEEIDEKYTEDDTVDEIVVIKQAINRK